MAYVNLKNTTIEKYDQIIYSGDAKYKIKITFNGKELENADIHLEKMERSSRVLPDDSSKRFTLDNFVAQTIQLTLHDIDTSIIQEPINISLGTLIDSAKSIYEYVPLGVFNIQEKPTTDKGVTTLKLIDNRVKFDTPYDGSVLIKANNGSVTKKQVLDDICKSVGVINDITTFLGEDDKLGIYDNTIKATTYVAYMLEQAGCFAIITREGHLGKVELNNLTTHRIPSSIVEENYSKEKDKNFKVERVVYEDAIRKYDSNTDENVDGSTLQTLYLNAANPYISSQEQVESIYTKLKDFEINSVVTQKVMGNPRIDPWDIIEVYDYYSKADTKPILFRTLANQEMTYTGVLLTTYKTEIGTEAQKENVTISGNAVMKKWARTEIDNVNAEITIQAGQIQETQNNLENNYYNKSSVDTLIINSATGVTNTFSEAGGNNVFRNTGLWFGPDTTTEEKEASSTNGKIEIDDGADNTLSNLKIYGNTSQEGTPTPDTPIPVETVTGGQVVTVCGKNLLDLSSFVNFTSQGVTFTKENGIIKATGTPTATSWNRRLNITLPAGTYTFSGVDNLNADGLRLILHYDDNEEYVIRKNDSSKTFTLNEEKTYGLVIWVQNITDFPTGNVILTPMIEKGSTATTYEPYQGNTYNIDLPVENLLQLPNGSKTTNGITATITNGKLKIVGTTTTNWFSICNLNIPLESGTYTFSYTNKKVYRYNLNIKYADNTTQVIYGNVDSNTQITLNQKATITAMFSDGNTTGATFDYEDYLMIEKGSKANKYTPYGTTPIELCKIGDYQDRIYKDNGSWYLHKEIGKYNFTGNETIKLQNSGKRILISANTNPIPEPLHTTSVSQKFGMYSNKLVEVTAVNTWTGIQGVSYDYDAGQNKGNFDISINGISTLEEYKTAIVGIELVYILQTPTNTEITDTELINQLNSIKTIDGYNLILLASNDVDTEFDITYLIDFTSYEYWTGDLGKIKEEKAANLNALLLQHGEVYQEQQVPNGNYTISFKYKKLINLANVKCIINDVEYELTANDDTEFTQTIDVSTQHIRVTFTSDRQNSCEIYDLMVNAGKVKLAYSQNQNETTTDTVNISKGITITSTDTDTTFKANADGIRTLNKNGNVLTKFTDTGMTTKEMIVEDTSQIVGVLVQQVGGQTWFTKL